ncbi:MAG: hypothetical protein IKO06_01880 [Alphaproteobacteria bacterium]|nr:hypothetical protein [Alphaproteobacteria bacterium]
MKNFEIKNNGSLAPCGRERQSGRSMIEMLGVLAIIGVLSVGGIAGYSKAMSKYRINKTIEQISLIVGNIRTFFAPQRNYEGLEYENTAKILRKAKLVPDEMWEDGKDIPQNVFGGNVIVRKTYLDYSNYDDRTGLFMVGFENISYDACLELATHDWKQLNAYMCVIGEWYNLDELVAMVDDVVRQGSDECKRGQSNVISQIGWYWQCFGNGDEPLGVDDAVAACNNAINPSGNYQMVCAFR